MNNQDRDFIEIVAALRRAVIESGGKPDKIYISKAAIENVKIFGMDVEVSEHMPKDISVFVLDSTRYKL